MKSFVPSFLLETFQYFSSVEFDNSIPPEIAAIISKNSHDVIEDIAMELSKNLLNFIKNHHDFIRQDNIFNNRFIGNDGVRVTIKTGECVKNNQPLDQVIKSLEKLSTYTDEIATKVLLHCLDDTKCDWFNIMCIIDYAASQGYLNICKFLYKTLGSKVLIHSNDYGWTALHRSCYNNDSIAVKILLETIRNEEIWDYINIPGSNMLESPLFVAVTNGCIDVIRLLLNASGERACDYIMNDKNNRSASLFDSACTNGHLEVVKLLLETVGDENILSLIMLHNENSFIGAAGNGQSEIVKYLLEKIGDKKMILLKAVNHSKTALDNASFNGYLNVVKVIIKHAGDQVKELNLLKAIRETFLNKNIEIAEYLNDVLLA